MLIYNVTIHVHLPIAAQWLQWMKEQHIPAVMKSGCFTHYQVVRLLDTDESEGLTYAVQYYADSKALYNRYIEIYSPGLRKELVDKWGQNVIAFRSLMEIVH